MTTSGDLAEDLRRVGRRAGLDAVGICDAEPFLEVRAQLEARKADGTSAGMQFTFRNPARSTDPGAALPGARALVVGARCYRRADQRAGEGDRRPRATVARYSWIDHYRPLREALGVVAGHLVDRGWRARVLADDNALVDRPAAVRAGLGWYGKNANVLLPGHGSWFVLGSVVTDAPVAGAPTAAPADGCGRCTRCLRDCPTGALTAAGMLDARRCLAWLLQAPGVFPVEYREALGDRIYGCDECQARCPVNVRSARSAPEPPAPEPGSQPTLDVLDILAADDVTLRDMVGRWYIPGRDLRYVRRNALVVLANTADGSAPAVVDVLRRTLHGGDPLLCAHAVWAAARLGRHDLLGGVDAHDPMVATELALAAR